MREGIYRRVRPASLGGPLRPAVFLDRDGVIIEDSGYLCRVEDIRYIEGSLEAIRDLNRAGYLTIMVSNQSGIDRGYYGWSEFEAVQRAIETELGKLGGWLDGVWACSSCTDHAFRKPNPGMLLDAAEMLNVDLSGSVMVGDKDSDLLAGEKAGVSALWRVGAERAESAPGFQDLAALSGDLVSRRASSPGALT